MTTPADAAQGGSEQSSVAVRTADGESFTPRKAARSLIEARCKDAAAEANDTPATDTSADASDAVAAPHLLIKSSHMDTRHELLESIRAAVVAVSVYARG